MSYDTRYGWELQREHGLSIEESAMEALGFPQDETLFAELVKMVGYNPFNEACSWYDHDKHMAELSKRHPKVLFTLHGEGEENEDIWRKYFKAGKVQVCRAKITFDAYDPKKLEHPKP